MIVDLDALRRRAAEEMKAEAKRYSVPRDDEFGVYVEQTTGALVAWRARSDRGRASGWDYDAVRFATDRYEQTAPFEDLEVLCRDVRAWVKAACQRFYGPHEGEGLP